MADNIVGGGGGDAFMAQLLQNALQNQQQQTTQASDDQQKDDAIQRQLVQKFVQKQETKQHQQAAQQIKENYTSERAADRNWRDLANGKGGPELMQFANQANLQGKVTGKLKDMFLNAQSQGSAGSARAEAAAGAMNRLTSTQTFVDAAPTARDFGELTAKVLQDPGVEDTVRQALEHPFLRSADGDRGAKQSLAQLASRQLGSQETPQGRGVSVRMTGDLLGTLTGAKVPGFAQQASVKMMERNPGNLEGAKNIDTFVREPSVRAMPTAARGWATTVLAKGDGETGLRNSLTNVSKNDTFRGLGRDDKAKLYATIGTGRASDLRGITDKTLVALQQKNFPRQAQQVDSFLSNLGAQIARGNRVPRGAMATGPGDAAGASSTAGAGGKAAARGTGRATGTGAGVDIDPQELVSVARRGGLPARPSLRRIPGSAEDDAAPADASQRRNQALKSARAAAGAQAAPSADGSFSAGKARRPAAAAAAAAAGTPPIGDADVEANDTQAQNPPNAAGVGAQTARGASAKEKNANSSANRAAIQSYYVKLNRHYERVGETLKRAKYFEDVNLLSGLKRPPKLDLSALDVGASVQSEYEGKFAALQAQYSGKEINREKLGEKLKGLQSEAFGRTDLTADEKTWVYARAAGQQTEENYQDLVGYKQRVLRNLRDTLMPPEMRRQRLAERRPQGSQPRYFRSAQASPSAASAGQADQQGTAVANLSDALAGRTGQPVDARKVQQLMARVPGGQARAAQVSAGPAQGAAATAAASGASQTAALAGRAGAAASVSQGPGRSGAFGTAQGRSATTRAILQRVDPSLSTNEQMQQAKELLAQDLQRQAMQMASDLMDEIMRRQQGTAGTAQTGSRSAPEGLAASNDNTQATVHSGDASATPGRAVAATSASGQGSRASSAHVTGKSNFYGVPQSFERDLGANQNVRAVRAPSARAQSMDADELTVGDTLTRQLMKSNATIRPLGQLVGQKMKDMDKLEANALRNLGWDAVSWGAQGNEGAQYPNSYRTRFSQLRPLQKDSVRALGHNESSWDALVARFTGGDS